MSHGWAGGSTRAWRKLRAALLAQNVQTNRGRCTLAIPGVCTTLATQLHHIHGKAVTGDDPRYLAAVCQACNLHIGDPSTAPDPPVLPRTRW